MALKYATKFPVKGLFLVAPARAFEPEMMQFYGQFQFHTTIVWGSEDNIIPSEDMRTLANKLPNAKLIVYNNASHSAYKDEPEQFKQDLLEFYAKTE
jgi:pimeloyl-ACP methyl ester carboxylesterase